VRPRGIRHHCSCGIGWSPGGPPPDSAAHVSQARTPPSPSVVGARAGCRTSPGRSSSRSQALLEQAIRASTASELSRRSLIAVSGVGSSASRTFDDAPVVVGLERLYPVPPSRGGCRRGPCASRHRRVGGCRAVRRAEPRRQREDEASSRTRDRHVMVVRALYCGAWRPRPRPGDAIPSSARHRIDRVARRRAANRRGARPRPAESDTGTSRIGRADLIERARE